MPHRPYKPTIDFRATLTQEARVFLDPEVDAPPGSFRQVQILIPTAPGVRVGIDKEPKDLGLDRSYKLANYPPGAMITYVLLPQQFLTGASIVGFAEASVIVQFLGAE